MSIHLTSNQELISIDADKNNSLFIEIKAKERDSWHKLWLYGFILMHSVLLCFAGLVMKFFRSKKLRKHRRNHTQVN